MPEPDRESSRKLNDELKASLEGDDTDRIRAQTEAVMTKFQASDRRCTSRRLPRRPKTAPGRTSRRDASEDDVVEGEIVDEGGSTS